MGIPARNLPNPANKKNRLKDMQILIKPLQAIFLFLIKNPAYAKRGFFMPSK